MKRLISFLIIIQIFLSFLSSSAQESENEKLLETAFQEAEKLHKQGDYSEAIRMARAFVYFAENHYSFNKSYLLVIAQNKLGFYLMESDKYDEADSLFRQALDVSRTSLPEDSPLVLTLINNLAQTYFFRGWYDEAEPLLLRILDLNEKANGKTSIEVVPSLVNLAALYINQNNFANARYCAERALKIQKEKYGEAHPDMAQSLNNLGQIYLFMGQQEKAISFYLEAIAIFEKFNMENNPGFPIVLNNLAESYSKNNQSEKALNLIEKAVSLCKKNKGEENSTYQELTTNLIGIYVLNAQWEKALELHKQTIMIKKRILGNDHPKVALSYYYMGEIYRQLKQYKLAEDKYQQSLEICEHSVGEYNFLTKLPLIGLIITKGFQSRIDETLPLFRRVFKIDEVLMRNIFSNASEKEKYLFLSKQIEVYDLYLFILNINFKLSVKRIFTKNDALNDGMDLVLNRKGLIVDEMAKERLSLASFMKEENSHLLEQYKIVCSKLASIYLTGQVTNNITSYNNKLMLLNSTKDSLEQEIALNQQNNDLKKVKDRVKYQLVAEQLPPESVLIEYVIYKTKFDTIVNPENVWDGYKYCAFVLKSGKDSQPILVDLIDAKISDIAIKLICTGITEGFSKSNDEKELEKSFAKKSNLLYQYLFAPLEKAIGAAKILYISPDGNLNLLPFGILQDDEKKYLTEKYQINYISSGRDICKFDKTKHQNRDAVIIANPDYNLGGKFREKAIQNLHIESTKKFRSTELSERSVNLNNIFWPNLPNTRIEAEKISMILTDHSVKLYLDNEAQEEIFKQLIAPDILHVATHGFFLQDIDKNQLLNDLFAYRGFQLSNNKNDSKPTPEVENPLLRSGLVLAGANLFSQEEKIIGLDDGILTAYEISGMNLSGTKLVVLSACETGIGETRYGDGVYGLRRAFQIAGAEAVVMSLWKVPDEETKNLMINFYKRMQKGEGKSQALQNAQLDMMKMKREKFGAAHPYFWGAFVCVGNPN